MVSRKLDEANAQPRTQSSDTYLGDRRREAVTGEPLDRFLGHLARGIHQKTEAFAQASLPVHHRLVTNDDATCRAEQVQHIVVHPVTERCKRKISSLCTGVIDVVSGLCLELTLWADR